MRMTPHQREQASRLIASFGEAKREASRARALAEREALTPAEVQAKEQQLAQVLQQMDQLTRELWDDFKPPPAATR